MSTEQYPKEDLYAMDKEGLPIDKSSLSGGTTGGCVGRQKLPGGGVALYDLRNPSLPPLCFDAHEWACFIGGVRQGELD